MKTALFQAFPAAFAFLALLLGNAAVAEESAKKPTRSLPKKPTLVINLVSGEDNLHAVTMGLHFAEHGLADRREVVIFFNVKSPSLARKNLADNVRFKDKPSIKEMIAKLGQGGAKMVVCPMCAEVMGVKAGELAPGIEMIKEREQIFDYLHENSVVFTY